MTPTCPTTIANLLLELLKVMPVTIVGAVAVYVAWQQWQTNQQRLRLDLYDRRLGIYEEVRNFIVVASNDPQTQDLAEFRRATAQADFLFGEPPNPVTEYLDELVSHATQFQKWNQKYKDYTQTPPTVDDLAAVVEGRQEELQWFLRQHDNALRKFKEHLNLRA